MITAVMLLAAAAGFCGGALVLGQDAAVSDMGVVLEERAADAGAQAVVGVTFSEANAEEWTVTTNLGNGAPPPNDPARAVALAGVSTTTEDATSPPSAGGDMGSPVPPIGADEATGPAPPEATGPAPPVEADEATGPAPPVGADEATGPAPPVGADEATSLAPPAIALVGGDVLASTASPVEAEGSEPAGGVVGRNAHTATPVAATDGPVGGTNDAPPPPSSAAQPTATAASATAAATDRGVTAGEPPAATLSRATEDGPAAVVAEVPAAAKEQGAEAERPPLYLCLSDIYPASALTGLGVPAKVGATVSSYAQHVSVVLGEAPGVSWELQLDAPDAYWEQAVVHVAAGLRMRSTQSVEEQVEFARQQATAVTGSAKLNVSEPATTYKKAGIRCFRGPSSSSCSRDQIDDAARQFRDAHPDYRLGENDCVKFGCHLMAACATEVTGTCDVATCQANLRSAREKSEKTPGCGLLESTPPTPATLQDETVPPVPLAPQTTQQRRDDPYDVAAATLQPLLAAPMPVGSAGLGGDWMGWWSGGWQQQAAALAPPDNTAAAWQAPALQQQQPPPPQQQQQPMALPPPAAAGGSLQIPTSLRSA